MRFKILVLICLILTCFVAGCGDGSKESAGVKPPTAKSVATRGTSSPEIQLVVPCALDEYVQITPNLLYDVKVVDGEDGLMSLRGVLMDTCMGQTGLGKKTTAEKLGNGVEKWLESTYPRGATEQNQTDFEAKVCTEIARIISSDPSLRKITWVSLATNGIWDISKLSPPKVQSGRYTPPGCSIPKSGPSA